MDQKSAYQRAQELKVNTGTIGETPSGYMNKKDDRYSIDNDPIPFDSTTDARLTTTLDLASLINALFNKVYRDYVGCNIYLDQAQNRWKASLYFCENANASAEDAVKNLEPISSKFNNFNTDGSRTTIGAKVEGFTARSANIHYDLSQATKDSLSKFYMPWEFNRKGEIEWRKVTTEQQEQANYGYSASSIYINVSGVDVVKLLMAIYGNKNESNHYVDYAVTAIRPLSQMQSNNSNMLLNIQRIDQYHVEELCRKIGAIPSSGRLPIIR